MSPHLGPWIAADRYFDNFASGRFPSPRPILHAESSSLLVTRVLLSTFLATFLSRRHVTFRLRPFSLPPTTCRQTGHFQAFFPDDPRLKPFEFRAGGSRMTMNCVIIADIVIDFFLFKEAERCWTDVKDFSWACFPLRCHSVPSTTGTH
jgi:hypothetical protein